MGGRKRRKISGGNKLYHEFLWKYYILFILASKCIKNARVRREIFISLLLLSFRIEQLSGFSTASSFLLPFRLKWLEILPLPHAHSLAIIMYYDDGSFLTFITTIN